MVRPEDLTPVLSEFARTMLTDYKVQSILDGLVEHIVRVLGVTGVGITLISPGLSPRYVSASSELAMHLERLQSAAQQGPCLTACENGEPVSIVDLGADTRYPEFSPAAREAGMASIFAFPLRHSTTGLGALDVYRDVPGSLEPDEMTAAQTLADVAAAYLVNAEARAHSMAAADRFRERSLHDSLTGLANRVLLQEHLDHAARRARRSQARAAVMFIDLDRFKRVNDLYGHGVGDGLLAAVAARLSSLVRPGDTLARVSGDEFVILCEEIDDVAVVEQLAARVVDGFTAPFVVERQTIHASVSVGVAYSRSDAPISEDLMNDADTAMYQAKRRGGGTYRMLDLQEALERRAHDALVESLHAAVSRDGLGVAYQPIVRASDGVVVGVEALLRWQHPTRGLIPAPVVVEIAEQSALVADLGRWVLGRACRDRVQWLAEHPGRQLDLSVNVSAAQVLRAGFADVVRWALDSTGLPPSSLILEMSEDILVEHPDRAQLVLRELKDIGVLLVLDRFGAGNLSLTKLRELPVDVVKIDPRLIGDLVDDPSAAAIVEAVVNLAHVLDMSVVAAGVESEALRETVVSLGCDLAQGFHFARPRTSSDIDADLELDPLVLPRLA